MNVLNDDLFLRTEVGSMSRISQLDSEIDYVWVIVDLEGFDYAESDARFVEKDSYEGLYIICRKTGRCTYRASSDRWS